MHHFNVHNLTRAFHELDGSKACGIDRVTKSKYQKQLTENIEALRDAIKRGGWHPRPAREVLIPKPQGGTRPLAVGCLEDKIVQTLTARILEAIFDPLFDRHSYGFRQGRSAHQAVGRLYYTIDRRQKHCVVVEMDIEKFFNSMDHEWLMQRLEEHIDDSKFLRHVRRLLRNSILSADGTLRTNERGSPQGSPVSPVLANVYLHFLLDRWFRENHSGRGEMVRYADDAVFIFTDEAAAQAFQTALSDRLKLGGLTLNLDKSRVVPFSSSSPKGNISFLGFDFYWGRHAVKLHPLLKVKTSVKRLHRGIQAFKEWIKLMRNRKKLDVLWERAAARLRGHFNYFGVVFNGAKVQQYHFECVGELFKWLNRRSQRRSFTWEQFERRLRFCPLPEPPKGSDLIDITSEQGPVMKHRLKSRMPKLGTYGSVRNLGGQS
jgi:group II intron reverse transcriptase/maturase